jgi:hypothetical protein
MWTPGVVCGINWALSHHCSLTGKMHMKSVGGVVWVFCLVLGCSAGSTEAAGQGSLYPAPTIMYCHEVFCGSSCYRRRWRLLLKVRCFLLALSSPSVAYSMSFNCPKPYAQKKGVAGYQLDFTDLSQSSEVLGSVGQVHVQRGNEST